MLILTLIYFQNVLFSQVYNYESHSINNGNFSFSRLPFKLCMVWNWFIVKITLIFQKCSEAIQNGSKSECSRLEQRLVIKFLMPEKCKLCEIYRRMCDVYGGVCYSKKKMFKNQLATLLERKKP